MNTNDLFYNLERAYGRITAINIVRWVIAYVVWIFIYTQLPESVWVVRPFMTFVAQVLIVVIMIAAIEKARKM
ncbi:MAG TPA: hypothetical protein VNA68_00585 [Candidatus Dormibacteraeota bacterium]|nr:hypothetical protein [Candidatus Dormibacteraeota bacterium]